LDGERVAISGFIDITDHIQAEETLIVAQDEILKKNAIMNTLQENLTSGVFMVEAPSGRPLIVNPAAKNLLGQGILPDANKYNLSQVYGAYKPTRTDPYPVEEMPIIRGMYGERSQIDDMIILHPDGKETWLEVIGGPILDDEGKVWASLVSFQDITERKEMEQRIFKEKEQFKTTLLSVGDGVISTDITGNVLIMNKVSEEITGWTQEEAFGKPIEEVFHILNEFTSERCDNPVTKILETGETVELANHTLLISKDGIERPIEDSAAPIKDEGGNITGVVLVFRDFTEKKKIQDEIKYLSFHDHLTGLYNRRFFEVEMGRLDTARNLPISIIMGDVNGLKLINDTFGHSVGDELLVKATKILKDGCRADDIVARVGGDEIAILLPKTDASEAKELIKRLQGDLKKERIRDIEISISFGWKTKKESTESTGLGLSESRRLHVQQ
jgi:diguanylate cyclase (GGDEF)-like protein/PAS domain S-box-containing protein